MTKTLFQKLFGDYPVLPNTYNIKALGPNQTVSYPTIAGAIDDKNDYHQLKIHYRSNYMMYSTAFDMTKLNLGSGHQENCAFEYIRTPYENFVESLGSPISPYYMNKSNTISDLSDSIYPVGLRYIDNENEVAVFERPPFKMNIDFSPVKARQLSSKYRKRYEMKDVSIWIPWTVYLFNLSSKSQINMSVYFNDRPLNSVDDIVFACLLPNVFAEGKVCFGDYHSSINDFHAKMVKKKNYSLKSLFNECLSYFYSGGWNNDIIPHGPLPPSLRMYDSTRSMKLTLKDDKTIAIYERAHENAEYYDVSKTRGTNHLMRFSSSVSTANYLENYLNALCLWSQYSLEEVMYLFKNHYDSARNHYKADEGFNETYDSVPGSRLDSLIKSSSGLNYSLCEQKRQKLQGVFNTFVNGNNAQNVINYDDPIDHSGIHQINFGFGKALRKVYYVNPLNNQLHYKDVIVHQKELHDILDFAIKDVDDSLGTIEVVNMGSLPQMETIP